MNIVYLLTNTSKTEGKRFYIGSKTECQIADVDGVPTIIGREGKPYYSSSSSFEFKTDITRGDVFVASVLEEVPNKRNLIQVEDSWINKMNAVMSDEYYNMSNAVLNMHNADAVANLFGESVKELAKNNSALSKRDNSAKDLGYSNFGELCFDIWKRYKINNNWQVVSDSFGKERHWASVIIKPFDMDKAEKDLSKATSEQVRQLIAKKCSLNKVAEILDIELPTARVLLGDFYKTNKTGFSVASLLGKTQGELEAAITKDVIVGMCWTEVCKKHGVNETSAKRYFMRCVRRHLAPEDISDVIYETEDELVEARKKRKIKQQRLVAFKDNLKQTCEIEPGRDIQSNNRTGHVGVCCRTLRCGKKTYTAYWTVSKGKKSNKSFSEIDFGEAALQMAVDYRAKMIAELR